MNKIKVLLVDDSEIYARSIGEALAANDQLQVIAVVNSAPEALSGLASAPPDLVLMDVNMPVMTGLEATRLIKARANPPKVVLISVDDSPHCITAARSAGADAFLSKSDIIQELPPVLDTLFGPGSSRSSRDSHE